MIVLLQRRVSYGVRAAAKKKCQDARNLLLPSAPTVTRPERVREDQHGSFVVAGPAIVRLVAKRRLLFLRVVDTGWLYVALRSNCFPTADHPRSWPTAETPDSEVK